MTYSDRATAVVYRLALTLTAVALAVSLALMLSALSPRRWDINTGRIWTECNGQGVSLSQAEVWGCEIGRWSRWSDR